MKMSMQGIAAVLAVALLLSFNAPGVATAQAKETILIKAGQLVDVKNGRVLTNQAILVEGDRIKEVGDAAAIAGRAPANVRVVDLSNATVLPGLIDLISRQTRH